MPPAAAQHRAHGKAGSGDGGQVPDAGELLQIARRISRRAPPDVRGRSSGTEQETSVLQRAIRVERRAPTAPTPSRTA